MSIKLKPAIILTTLLTMSSIHAQAAENNAGIIHFTGEIIEPSCEILEQDGTDSTVPLGTYPTSLFTGPGVESPLKPFTITLVDCPVTSAGLPAVKLTFTGSTTLTKTDSLLDVSQISTSGTVAAQGVGIAVTPNQADTTYIKFDGSDMGVEVGLPDLANDAVEATFNARYKSFAAASAVKAGAADADMTINILYR
ncbi:fimbrial protein [Scandinavium sp. V105_16]|uniref:Fimbrial protein n=1 Tax=Scandinavium lactucae TaxID=3095028 RepID=A0AAJ2RYT5_9ENTR|nr:MULTISPECIES: fimbrial protein [unclassified Scandinavium]MDX6019939.1 fimbrial protein [Scandinavium sp. V105_16]MDX6031246.1 fimbrial protein [Scandinavium sp. V105_12]